MMTNAIPLNAGMPDPGEYLTVFDRVTGLNIALTYADAKAWLHGELSLNDHALCSQDRAALRRFAKEGEDCA